MAQDPAQAEQTKMLAHGHEQPSPDLFLLYAATAPFATKVTGLVLWQKCNRSLVELAAEQADL
jgi:hypothetical protein